MGESGARPRSWSWSSNKRIIFVYGREFERVSVWEIVLLVILSNYEAMYVWRSAKLRKIYRTRCIEITKIFNTLMITVAKLFLIFTRYHVNSYNVGFNKNSYTKRKTKLKVA